jgi:outer membrane protein
MITLRSEFFTLACVLLLLPAPSSAQQLQQHALPDAPTARLIAQAPSLLPSGAPQSEPPQKLQAPPAGPRLTLAEAERIALQRNPNISIAHLLQLAQAQVVREARAADLPSAFGDLTAVGAHDNSRITAGALNNPTVYDRAAGGLTVSQLITDFGRTHNLIRNAQSNSRAQLDLERASAEDITLAVDQAFYQGLATQQVLRVAQQTVATRQATGDQIGALTKNNLRFLGSEDYVQYELVDEMPESPAAPPVDPEVLVELAFNARPDLSALNDRFAAARQFASAEHDLLRPTVSAIAAAGGTPVRADQIQSSWYGAAGANISIPVFNGFDYVARGKEADLRAQAAAEQVRNLRDSVARDVRAAVLTAQAAFQRIGVSQQLLDQANTALDLAQARYKVGLSGIVDLTQAQLAQTQAEITVANARYAYQTALAEVRFQTVQ